MFVRVTSKPICQSLNPYSSKCFTQTSFQTLNTNYYGGKMKIPSFDILVIANSHSAWLTHKDVFLV